MKLRLLICEICGKEFNQYGMPSHVWRVHGEGRNFKFTPFGGDLIPWNKGKTRATDPRIVVHAESISKALIGKPGHKITREIKIKISQGMKLAHEEGRAWNIGLNHWKGEPSYPEKFFMKVVANDFSNKDYRFNLVVGRFRIDFAWEQKKLAIEIDGEQHELPEHKKRDHRKDIFLVSEGWKILRIKWKDMFYDPQYWITSARKFIEN
jgi:very-short-patch-repair endonuclease